MCGTINYYIKETTSQPGHINDIALCPGHYHDITQADMSILIPQAYGLQALSVLIRKATCACVTTVAYGCNGNTL